MMFNYDAVIVGAGACGLMCAVQAGFLGKRVLVLEKNDKPGAKILISGGGRCNYTNLHTTHSNFLSGNQHFCKSAFSRWTVEDTLSFFESYGIRGHEKTLGQLFPVSNNAKDIVKVFTDICEDFGQEIRCNCEVKAIEKADKGFKVSFTNLRDEQSIEVPKVVMTSGGLPVQKMGATDFALRVAGQFGLEVTETAPALVPLTITGKDADWYAQLSGNSIYCRVYNNEISFEENILFTHWGLSGPAILQISSYWRPGEIFTIDLFPSGNIIEAIANEKQENGKKLLLTFLSTAFSKKLAEAFGKFLPVEKNLASLTKADMERVENLIHKFKVKPAGDRGYDKAEVMRGGVATYELSSKTLEAKKNPGLFFGGECVDVTGWLGGYN